MSYMYTVSRLRAMESTLLEASFFSRLMDSPTLEDATKALGETPYSQWLAHNDAESGFDKVIDDELLYTCNDLKKFVPDVELLDFYRMPYDFNNVKVVLKSLLKVKDGGERRYDLLTNLGATDTESIIFALEGESYGLLPYALGDAIPRCLAVWEQTKNIQQVETILDGWMFQAMLNLAESLKMPVTLDWVRQKIDAENLRNAVRLQRMGHEAVTALPFFHKGGTIAPESVAKLLNEPLESWSKALSYTSIGRVFDVTQEKTDIQSSLSEIQKALDEYLVRLLEKAKYASDAPENVILYLLYKEMEARNLRVTLVCVANGLNREYARRLLNHVR